MQCEFTDNRFSRDAVPKDFIGRIQDITDYLSHLPETQVNRADCQKYFGSENGSFMRNKRHVFFCVCVCPNIYGQQKYFDHIPYFCTQNMAAHIF